MNFQNPYKMQYPIVGKKYFMKMKLHASTKEPLEYDWNRIYDPYNYTPYKKISWIALIKFDCIASNIYKDDFTILQLVLIF